MAAATQNTPVAIDDGQTEEVARQLALLNTLNRSQLQRHWLKLFPTAAHPRLSKALLVQILAYRIQEETFGGLSAEAKARLNGIPGRAATDGSRQRLARVKTKMRPRRTSAADEKPRKKKPATPVSLKPGTRLLRQWHSQTHAVTVVLEGYEYQGSRYKSLSEIARLITGTRWSGPLFFGLKNNGSTHSRSQPLQ